MAFSLLTSGFGGMASINGHRLLLTSFALSMDSNLIKSDGVTNLWDGVNGRFSRYGGLAFKDHSEYDLSLAFDVTTVSLFNLVLNCCVNQSRLPMSVIFEDVAYNILYTFDSAYVRSMSFDVGNNGVASVKLGFFIARRDLVLDLGGFAKSGRGVGGLGEMSLDLMPYWAFKVKTDDLFVDEELLSFNFSFEQGIVPKFGCVGSDSDLPELPSKLIFALPKFDYSLEYLIRSKTDLTIDAHDYFHDNQQLQFYFMGSTPFLTFNSTVINSISLNLLSNKGNLSFSVSGGVLGGAEFTMLEE